MTQVTAFFSPPPMLDAHIFYASAIFTSYECCFNHFSFVFLLHHHTGLLSPGEGCFCVLFIGAAHTGNKSSFLPRIWPCVCGGRNQYHAWMQHTRALDLRCRMLVAFILIRKNSCTNGMVSLNCFHRLINRSWQNCGNRIQNKSINLLYAVINGSTLDFSRRVVIDDLCHYEVYLTLVWKMASDVYLWEKWHYWAGMWRVGLFHVPLSTKYPEK